MICLDSCLESRPRMHNAVHYYYSFRLEMSLASLVRLPIMVSYRFHITKSFVYYVRYFFIKLVRNINY